MFGRTKAPEPPKTLLAKCTPLLIFFTVLGVFAYIGYHIYVALLGIGDAAAKKLDESNMSFTKDGVKVKVKELDQEGYGDGMQRVLTKAWDYSSWPAYKSRIWNQKAEVNAKKSKKTK